MRSLALASQKGGVGKTTVALNLAYALARRGWKTLLVDADPQGAVGLSLQGGASRGEGLVELLEGQAPLDTLVLPTRLPELHLLPAGRPSPDLAARWGTALAGERGMRGLLAEADATYDVVLIDTPSGLHGSNLEVLRTVNRLLVPIQAEPLALRSVTQVLEAVGRMREEGSRVSVAGFVITMLSSRQQVSLSVAQEAWAMLPVELVLEGFVPRDDVFLLASAHGVPLGLLSKRPPPVATVFDRIAAELESRLGLVEEEEAEIEPIALLD